MGLINRDLINRNIQIYTPSNSFGELTTYSYSDIIQLINRAKTYLVNDRKCKPGQKVLLATSGWPQYVAWWTAVAELGMSFVVSDHPYINTRHSVANKLTLYGEIDHFIGNLKGDDFPLWPDHIRSTFIDRNIIFDYKNETLGELFLHKENDVILYSTSSGTTGTPKVIKHTHKFFYDLLHRNAKLYDLKEEDRCLHTKGLHHGSVTGVYFLPTLKYCRYHYQAASPAFDKPLEGVTWVTVLQHHKIDRCLLFYRMVDQFCDAAHTIRKDNNTLVYVLAKLSKRNVDTLVRDLGYRVQSIFGCTETSGPLFLPEINRDNYSSFNSTDFGNKLDDFYGIDINSHGRLSVTMPDGSVVDTGDIFERYRGKYVFYGRPNLCRINGETFYLDTLVGAVEQIQVGKKNTIDFDLVFDQQTEMVYMRSDEQLSVSKLNKRLSKIIPDANYRISKLIVGKRQDFCSGIKFDPEEVRLRCRGF